jgi:hypothetical protein
MNTVKINNMILTPVPRHLSGQILNQLYEKINMSKYRYQMMSEKTHVQEVVNTKHVVSYHTQGFNFILFLTFVDGKPFNCMISKKELKFYMNQNNLNDVKVYTFRMRYLKDTFYQGTIFDGKLIKTNTKEGKFLVYDSYYLCGQTLEQMNILKKSVIINKVLLDVNANLAECNAKIEMTPLFSCDEVPKMVYEQKVTAYNINGLVFIPEVSGKLHIYVNDSEFEHIRTGCGRDDGNIDKPSTNESQQEFMVKKTDIPDVYELYWNTNNGLIREGIAYVPNMFSSHHLRKVFKEKEMQKMTCVKSLKFNKWLPLCQDINELSTVLF